MNILDNFYVCKMDFFIFTVMSTGTGTAVTLNWNHRGSSWCFISPLAHLAQLCHSFHVTVS